jgi:protein-ribulosamine 3-kinase
MSLPSTLRDTLEPILGDIVCERLLGGGCIANATRIDTTAGAFFLKWSGGTAGQTFEAEAAGLDALRKATDWIRIPDVISVSGPNGDVSGYLVLEFIEEGSPGPDFWRLFGEGLAAMHGVEGDAYGFAQDNFIGRLPQKNAWMEAWPEFFRDMRLLPQVEMARANDSWKSRWDKPMNRLLAALPDILPQSPTRSTLHGDLWSGNYLIDSEGRAVLIDPAAYYGDRETDLAMMQLFGGFDRQLFTAYEAAWPLSDGHEYRQEIYRLYHLINHLNHFGGSYAGSVEGALRRVVDVSG